jgi:hypothetical protein
MTKKKPKEKEKPKDKKTYMVRVKHTIEESAWIEVEAEDPQQAADMGLEIAQRGDAEFYADDHEWHVEKVHESES